jgi:hypothetical protein
MIKNKFGILSIKDVVVDSMQTTWYFSTWSMYYPLNMVTFYAENKTSAPASQEAFNCKKGKFK